MRKIIIIFGGTTEGRILAENLSQYYSIILVVATEYGSTLVNQTENLKIISRKMTEEEMIKLLTDTEAEIVIDATHPYAFIVTENIENASVCKNVPYYRIKREEDNISDFLSFASIDDMLTYLNKTTGNVFVATGVKELEKYIALTNFSERVFIRIIPMVSSLEKASNLGFKLSNIICMQGPFTEEQNISMLRWSNAKYMITKNSGDTGGFSDKIKACEKQGITPIVISRPMEKKTDKNKEIFHVNDMLQKLLKDFKCPIPDTSLPLKFPIFTDLSHKEILVIGGGKIATGRVQKLLPFGGNITVIAPEISEDLQSLVDNKKISYIKSCFEEAHIQKPFMIIAATNNREKNKEIGEISREKDILVSVTDAKEECSFWFPAIAQGGNYIAGIISVNGNHKGVKELKNTIGGLLNYEKNN